MDEVRERLLIIHAHHGNPLSITALELLVTRDVHLVERERHVLTHPLEHPTGAVTKVASRRRVEADDRYG
jgi:hypothetical protein